MQCMFPFPHSKRWERHAQKLWGGGREEGKLAVYTRIGEEKGVLYHSAGEPGTGGKAADVGGNGVFYLHGRVCAHRDSGGA